MLSAEIHAAPVYYLIYSIRESVLRQGVDSWYLTRCGCLEKISEYRRVMSEINSG